ncbi:tRNA pseudouridine13 synthase [Methanolobus vulcani]|jgi:tRNA pseudouridine13 synthase|uniref:Probable tRNA pseudouridine synthase D n=1 Tax=Methanolobus vulcani TaxID=38026 RepID=A0A7Z7AWN3_9EURY|nr:tRNA pseudouridine(13) synthase TruD [Methanolobus vulcani]MDK2826608.1 tRNA pseudouridine13 synthase [Methanolobus sp.]MDK2948614.1 tRNA pseudouridine13 synthase [Methanolobus sp.]SDF86037.1 tRNA pseudouridine13 synthase [Methanolobus vulcani]
MIPEIEKKMGIELYSTHTEGIGGVLRQEPEDFIVKEITNREEGDSGKHLILELTKTNWDMHHLVRDMSRKLGISQKRIGFAGTKDKRAKTTQKISIYDVSEEDIENFYLKDVNLKVIGRSNRSIGLGDLYGNEFIITARDIDIKSDELNKTLEATTKEIDEYGGVPNFFGVQRFGAVRPVTHLVGEQLLRGDAEKAALIYIAKSFPDEIDDVKQVRNFVWETKDFAEGLKTYPLRLRYERAMMHYLVENPGDYAGSFSVLSPNIRKMFIHAYQSYVFNRIICERIEKGLPLNVASSGDIICFRNKEGLPDTTKMQAATDENVDGMNNLLKRDRAFITAPLVGYESEFAAGTPGELEKNVFHETEMSQESFRMKTIPDLASKGLRREILLHCKPEFVTAEDELNPGKSKVTLTFSLPKGSYATTVLREYMKTDPLKMS